MSIIFIYTLISFWSTSSPATTPDAYFGKEYEEAVAYCSQHNEQLSEVFAQYHIETEFALSLVFPEILRYNIIRDFLETFSLEMAYVHGGTQAANFSIGPFQMKPTFAEAIERKLVDNNIEWKDYFNYPADFSLLQIRRERLKRLKSLQWQAHYLAAFIHLQEKRFAHVAWENESERLAIFATAYNYRFDADIQDLTNVRDVKYFPYGVHKPNPFSYTFVALYFYNNEVH